MNELAPLDSSALRRVRTSQKTWRGVYCGLVFLTGNPHPSNRPTPLQHSIPFPM